MTELSRPWYYHTINEPWIDKESGMVNIVIKGDTSEGIGGAPDDYDNPALILKASQKVFSFYGKVLGSPSEIGSKISDFHFFPRPGATVILRYEFDAEKLERTESQFKAYINPDLEDQFVAHTTQLSTFKLSRQIKAIEAMFAAYQAKLRFFNGQLRPSFSFSQEYNKLILSLDRLKGFIKFNGYEYSEDEENKIYVSFNSSYDILLVEYNIRGSTKLLTKGSEYFLRDSTGLKSRTTNQLLANLSEIYDLRRAPPSWSEFLKSYSTGIEVDFFGPPSSPEFWNTTMVETANMDRMYMNAVGRRREDAAIYNNFAKMMNETAGRAEYDLRDKLTKFAHGVGQVQDKARVVEYYLNKFGINYLIEAGLECAAYQAALDGANFPDVAGIYQTMMGVDPYQEVSRFDWQLPRWPISLPVVGTPLDPLSDSIKEALEDAAFDALITFVKTLAEFLLELCKGFDDEYGEALSLASIAVQYPNYAESDNSGICLYDQYARYGISSELGNDFLEAVSDNVTPTESCYLINGASDALLDRMKIEVINANESFVNLEEIFNSPDHSILRGFFEGLSACISPDYCNKVLNTPPTPSDIDPCTVEEYLSKNISPNILDELVNAYDNLEIPQPDLGCGEGIIPSLADVPIMMTAVIRLLNALFDIPKTTFVGEVNGVEQAYIEIYPGEDTDMAYFERMTQEFKEDPLSTDAGANATSPGSPPGVGQVFTDLGFDSLLDNNLISSMQSNVEGWDAAAMARNMSTAVYRVSQEYKEELNSLLDDLYTPYTKDYTEDLAEKLSKLWFSVNMSDTSPGDLYFSVGAPGWEIKIISGPAPYQGDWLDGTTQALSPVGRGGLAYRFYKNTFQNLRSAWDPSDSPLTDVVKKSVYFPALMSVLNSMAHAVRASKLFDYEEFSKLLLSPRPCANDNRISTGDLLDIQNIINQGVEEFRENSCGENGIFCIIGPVEDAVIYAATNAFLQILLLEQLLKNIFFIETFGLGQFVGNPEIISRIIAEVKESIVNQQMGTSEEEAERMLDMVKLSSTMYLRKLLFHSDTEGSLPDPFGGEDIVITNPADPSWQQAVAYLIRKRLFDTMPAISEVFGIAGGNFGKTFLLKGLPRVDIVDEGIGGLMGPVEDFWRAGGHRNASNEVVGPWSFDTVSDEVADDGDGNGIWTVLPKGQGTATNPIQSLVNLGFPAASSGRWGRQTGTFGVEEYTSFYFDEEQFNAYEADADVSGTPEQILKYYSSTRVNDLLEETILPARARRGSGNYVVSVSLFEEFVRRITELAGAYSQSTLEIFEDIEVTYLFGQGPEDNPRHKPSIKGPLTIDNIDAIRFWINNIQKESKINEGREQHTSDSPWKDGPWGHNNLPPMGSDLRGNMVMQNPGYQKPFSLGQVDPHWNRPGPNSDGRHWYDPTTWESWKVWDAGRPYNEGTGDAGNWDWMQQFGINNLADSLTKNYNDFKDYMTDNQYIGVPPYTMLEKVGTAEVINNLKATYEGQPNRRSDRVNRAHRQTYDNGWGNDSWTWTAHNYESVWDDLWTNQPWAEAQDVGGAGRWRWSEGLASADSTNNKYLPLGRDDDMVTYWRPQKAEYLGDLDYSDFSGMSLDPALGGYNRINMLVYQTENGNHSDGRGHMNHVFKYIYQVHPYDLYGGIPFEDVTPKQWENIRDSLSSDSVAALMHSMAYDVYATGDPDAPVGYYGELPARLGWVKDKIVEVQMSLSLPNIDTLGLLSNREIYDLLELYVRTREGGRGGYYYDIPWMDAANPAPGQRSPGSTIQSPWMGKNVYGDTPKLINFTTVDAVTAIYVSDMEKFKILQNMSSVELRTLYEYYEGEGTTHPSAALALVGDTIKSIRAGARVVYYSPVISGPGMGAGNGASMAELKRQVVGLLHLDSVSRQKTNFFKERKNFILKLGGGTVDWSGAGEESRYVVNVGTNVRRSRILYPSIVDLLQDDGNPDSDSNGLFGEATITSTGGRHLVFRLAFNRIRDDLYNEMASLTAFDELFNQAINVTDLAAFIYLVGLNSADNEVSTYNNTSGETRSEKISKIFNDTKLSLFSVLRAAMAGDAYNMGPGRTAADAARDFAYNAGTGAAQQFGQMGASFVAKMLIETPLKILKSLAELVDPHVFVGTKIRDATGIAMDEIVSKSGLISRPELVDLLNEGLPILFPGIPGVDPFVQSIFEPKASSKGIDTIGKWPFLLTPPPGPLGLIYILLKLAEMDLVPPLEPIQCSEQLLLRDPDAPVEETPINPTTTYGCPDEEES
ncbi:hypothetical protein CL634_03455 [bacterium]|nr:hypothetical protein [bacterium]